MSSIALRRAISQIESARALVCAEIMQSQNFSRRQTFYHAALAAFVASWDNFIKCLLVEYFSAMQTIGDARLHQFSVIAAGMLKNELKKFNTPNFDKSREIINVTTGFDPFNVWGWPQKQKTPNEINAYLNEVLKVRHAFAHGSSIPGYTWTKKRDGSTRLTRAGVDNSAALFEHLSRTTDKELGAFFSQTYNTHTPW